MDCSTSEGREGRVGGEREVVVYVGSLLAVGLASGFASGLFGVGGGILRIPIFLYLFPLFGIAQAVTMHLAAGTSLAIAIPSSAIACIAQYRAGKLDLGFLRIWLPALAAGVLVGLAVARIAPGHVLVAVFAVIVALAGLQMLLASERFQIRSEPPSGPARAAIAATIGAISAVMGVTGGTLVTPTLSALGYPIHRAIAVSSAGGVVVSVVGMVGFIVTGLDVAQRPAYSLGYVDLLAVLVVTPAAMAMAPLGVRLANRLDKRVLKRVFGAFMLVVAADMAYDVIRAAMR